MQPHSSSRQTCSPGRAAARRSCVRAAARAVETTEPLFKRLGGGSAVRAAVDIFYEKMLGDNRVNFFFEGIDMKKQRSHQAIFLTFALGGAAT